MISKRLYDLLGYRLSVIARQQERRLEGQLNALGLTVQTARILVLAGRENVTRPKDIAEYAHLTQAAVSRMLRSLEAKGLIATHTRLSDRRESRVDVTPAGLERMAEAIALWEQQSADLRGHLTDDEYQALMTLLGRLCMKEIATFTLPDEEEEPEPTLERRRAAR